MCPLPAGEELLHNAVALEAHDSRLDGLVGVNREVLYSKFER